MKSNRKHAASAWLLLPHFLFPYLALVVFFGFAAHSQVPDIAVTIVLCASGMIGLAAVALGIFFVGRARRDEPARPLKLAWIAKLVHLPMFLFTVIYSWILIVDITGFGILIAIFFLIVDLAALAVTCVFPIAALIGAKQEGLIRTGAMLAAIVCQLVLFLDLIVLLIVWGTRKKQTAEAEEPAE